MIAWYTVPSSPAPRRDAPIFLFRRTVRPCDARLPRSRAAVRKRTPCATSLRPLWSMLFPSRGQDRLWSLVTASPAIDSRDGTGHLVPPLRNSRAGGRSRLRLRAATRVQPSPNIAFPAFFHPSIPLYPCHLRRICRPRAPRFLDTMGDNANREIPPVPRAKEPVRNDSSGLKPLTPFPSTKRISFSGTIGPNQQLTDIRG